MWGTPKAILDSSTEFRFIPTCVGNADYLGDPGIIGTVHPHVCGERFDQSGSVLLKSGSSPRVWGTRSSFHELQNRVGSSPRVWGTHCFLNRPINTPRFIPTCVGNALHCLEIFINLAVHPHVCGERFHNLTIKSKDFGSSPRVWGTLGFHPFPPFKFRFIPTCVGNA